MELNTPEANSDARHTRLELKALIETSRLLIESRDIDFITSNLLLIVMGKLLVTKAAILRHHPEYNGYKIEKVKGKTNLNEGDTVELNLSEEQLNSSSIYLADDSTIPEVCKENGLQTLINLRTGDQRLGFLCLGPRLGSNQWQEREKEFIESLATISAVAMANSEMVGELKQVNRRLDRRVNELNTLFEISKNFNTIIDRDQITNIFKFTMLGQMLIKQFFFLLDYSEERKMVSSAGIKEPPEANDIDYLFDFEDDVIALNDQHYAESEFLRENTISHLIALHLQGDKMAVIGVGKRPNETEYTESDINFLTSLGNVALLSIQKTFFLEERIEKERMEEELNIAKTIQQGLLPNPIPQLEGLELGAVNIPTHQVGGDYFDIEETVQGNYLIAIADVTGKGVPAALLMSNLQAMLQALSPLEITLGEATGRLNDNLFENIPSDKFITFFLGSYKPESQKLTYVNAGHNPPWLFRDEGETLLELDKGGLLLGAFSTMSPYEQDEVELRKGDLFVAFTDGITEAMSPQGVEFGEENLLTLIRQHLDKPVEDIITIITNRIESYSQGQQFDDITLIIFRVRGL